MIELLCEGIFRVFDVKDKWRVAMDSGVPTGGGLGVFKPPPPRNSEGPPKNFAKLNPIVKIVKKKLLNLWR
jgi:hypothetical protein